MTKTKLKADIELKPRGQLDLLSAECLSQKLSDCLRSGRRCIAVDAARIYPLLSEGLEYVRNFILHELREYCPFSITFVNIDPRSLKTLWLKDYPFIEGRLVFDVPSYMRAYSRAGAVVRCQGCGSSLQLREAVVHVCPLCGCHFKTEVR